MGLALEIVSTNLSDILALPDHDAAEALNQRMAMWDAIEKMHERSFVERGIIIREFERRHLWRFLIDPDTDQPFSCLTAWLSCSSFLGCRRTNFAAKKAMAMLADVPPEKLLGIPTGNIHVLTQLSTAVRNDPSILEAAHTLPREKLEERVALEHPTQHIESRRPLALKFGRSQEKTIQGWIAYALEHGHATTAEEAIVMACQRVWNDEVLDERLDSMPQEARA